MTVAAGWYCIVVGVVMFGWWGLDIRFGALRRPDRSPAEIGLHLAAETLTAVVLIAGGIILLTTGTAILAVSGLGMLLYTVIQSPGYFLARHEPAPVAMFAVLAVATVAAIASSPGPDPGGNGAVWRREAQLRSGGSTAAPRSS